MTSPRTEATATSKDGLDLCRAYFFLVWRKEIKEALLTGWHIQSIGVKTVQDLDGSVFFCVFVAGVIPTQKEKTQEGEKLYRLWFILDSNGSVYPAFCRCKGGANQGSRHLGATFFELDDFLSNQRMSICHFYVCILEPQTNTQTQTIPYFRNFLQEFEKKKKKNESHPLWWFLDWFIWS